MKNNIASIIMLSAGMVAVICCIIMKFPLDQTLIIVLITLFVFMILGFIAQRIIQKMNKEADERIREEEVARAAEEQEEELRRLKQQEEEENGTITEEQDGQINEEINDENTGVSL